jgi:PIN domain nuclease of toxin-antitoxin system
VKLLLDTHALLWFALDDVRLSKTAVDLIGEPANEPLLSVASCWEIASKSALANTKSPNEFESFIKNQIEINQLTLHPISIPHLAIVKSLPFHHRDPFDRVLVAQAIVEACPILSVDERFDAYGVQRIW